MNEVENYYGVSAYINEITFNREQLDLLYTLVYNYLDYFAILPIYAYENSESIKNIKVFLGINLGEF